MCVKLLCSLSVQDAVTSDCVFLRFNLGDGISPYQARFPDRKTACFGTPAARGKYANRLVRGFTVRIGLYEIVAYALG